MYILEEKYMYAIKSVGMPLLYPPFLLTYNRLF